jgi:hypothetical protein
MCTIQRYCPDNARVMTHHAHTNVDTDNVSIRGTLCAYNALNMTQWLPFLIRPILIASSSLCLNELNLIVSRMGMKTHDSRLMCIVSKVDRDMI